MASLFYTLDLIEIGKHKLNLNEYLSLLKIQHMEEGRSFPYEIDPRYLERLLSDKFVIAEVELSTGSTTYHLGEEGIRLFQGDEDLFEEFFALFPSSVDTGFGRRAISAKDPNSISGRATHDIWRRIVKNKPDLQRRIIDGLKRELSSRKASNSLGFIQGIDTWLRQATWEKWDDIPDKKDSPSKYIQL
jgi:hypothetical protein